MILSSYGWKKMCALEHAKISNELKTMSRDIFSCHICLTFWMKKMLIHLTETFNPDMHSTHVHTIELVISTLNFLRIKTISSSTYLNSHTIQKPCGNHYISGFKFKILYTTGNFRIWLILLNWQIDQKYFGQLLPKFQIQLRIVR